MKKLRFSRPSPALAVSFVALFVAMGGVSYGVASGSIDGREIKNRSVSGVDVKRDSLGGGAVKESTLGQVPASLNSLNLAGKGADKYTTRWALVNSGGQIERQSGGFTAVDCYQTNANCYIDAGEDVTNNGVFAEINAANTQGARLNGETGTAPCGLPSVNCAPPNTETANVIVIAPRNSDGSATTASNRFRFYVYVTGTENQ